ncbi:MAG: hypothetical protein JWO36_4231 [Myxococcales bacterium]|nr:hypothetical protein [Myxococcales bacterium]
MRARLAAMPAVVLAAGISPWWTCGLPWGGTTREPIGNTNGTPTPIIEPAYQSAHREEISPPEHRHKVVPETPPLRIGEGAVLHALDVAQPALLGCFHRAQHYDPTLISAKVSLNLFVDTSGQVMSVKTDVDDPKFSACLTHVARRLTFPPPSALAVADLTFFAW